MRLPAIYGSISPIFNKINIAAIGNITEQLHIHIIARHKTDKVCTETIWNMELSKLSRQDFTIKYRFKNAF